MSENNKIPDFQTERLTLKKVSLKYIDSYEKNFIDYEVIRYLSAAVPWPYPKDGVRDFLTSVILPQQGKDRWTWGIFLNDNPDELIGVVDLWRKGCPENRGFWLARKHWGKGIMTEAVNPVMNYAFENLGFDKLVFANALGNKRSRRIKEKTGAKFVEVKSAKFVDPKFTEHEIWELKKVDWVNYQNRAIFYLRKANEKDFEEIFMMGFDVWSDGQNKTDYLKECHESPKYKKGQWWVLEDGQKKLISSAITYDFGHSNWGIGSLATPANLRKKGFASELLKKLTQDLFNNSVKNIFLYADISPSFYEKHRFVSLPKKFQKYQSSTCMIKTDSPEKIWSELNFEAPNYF